jgi:dihydrofolate reductase
MEDVIYARPISIKYSAKSSNRAFKEKFHLLLGRKTYEIFAAYWPYQEEDAPHCGIAKLFNGIKKYAVSRSGEAIRAGRAQCSCVTSPM